jgi:hypothetical protein
VEGRAKKYAKGSDASGMYNVALAASSRGDGVAVGMRAVVSRTANAGLKIDYCTITRMLRAVLFLFHSSLIRESAGCGFHFPVYRVKRYKRVCRILLARCSLEAACVNFVRT